MSRFTVYRSLVTAQANSHHVEWKSSYLSRQLLGDLVLTSSPRPYTRPSLRIQLKSRQSSSQIGVRSFCPMFLFFIFVIVLYFY
jgi:hypothetical protein